MKLRFSIRFLLLLPVLLVAVIAWVSWPARTLSRFKEAVASGEHDDANAMIRLQDWTAPDGRILECSFESAPRGVELKCGGSLHFMRDHSEFAGSLALAQPNLEEVLLARRVYIPSQYGDRFHWFEFVVQRGTITLRFR